VISRIIEHCCTIKALIVGQDEREQGVRTLLNLGHTLGHAVEAITNYQLYRHGEAVSIGIVAAGYLAVELGMWSEIECQRLVKLLIHTGLPVEISGYDPCSLQELMTHDKKVVGDTLRWVLPRELGKAEISSEVSKDLVHRVLNLMVQGRIRLRNN
jgi:3-dehydroquinate synthase